MQFAICNVLLLIAALPPRANAHPVDLGTYERTIAVRVTAEGVHVAYRLELSPLTAVKDLLTVIDREELARLSKPADYYEAFTRHYAPILAANLISRLDGNELSLTCTRHSYQVQDHLLCDFVFQAPWDLPSGQPHEFWFREGNYDRAPGMIRLSIDNGLSSPFVQKTEPDEALKARLASERKPGDEERLRRVSATFNVAAREPKEDRATVEATAAPAQAEDASTAKSGSGDEGLLNLFLDSERGFWTMLLLATGLGAAHALTPGHGKTLVAAYLVGQRGTVWHALLLGLVTTLTHTGMVLVLALILWLYFPRDMPMAMRHDVETLLGLVSGLLIAGLGAWLLLRRLSGRADHFHLGGHGHPHHHHHGPADHVHDEQGHAHPLPERAGTWGLIILGAQGGILPCWDAVVLLLVAVAKNLLWFALPLLLAFSAGLASVLIGIGVLVVHARGLAGARWGESRLFRALPILSAALIMVLGLWLCLDHVHTGMAPSSSAVQARP